MTLSRTVLIETCSFYKMMFNHLKNYSKTNTKTRNNKEALSERGLWLDITKLVEGTEAEYDNCMGLTVKTRKYYDAQSRMTD